MKSCEVPLAPGPPDGGYVDFLPEHIQVQSRQGPPRTSFAEDLCFYLTTHGSLVGMTSPDSVSLFLQKIIASHYSKQFDYLRQNVSSAVGKMGRQTDFTAFALSAVEESWSDAQTIERRLSEFCFDLEEILIQLRVPLGPPEPSQIASWQDVGSDFRLLYHRFDYIRQYAERVNSSITGLASIAGNRQAFREQQFSLRAAERSRNLTFIGLVFIPLAFISSLFSMSEPYGPGGDRFWLYFAISVPMAALVVAVYYIADIVEIRYRSGRSIPFFLNHFLGLFLAQPGQRTSSRSLERMA